MCTIVTINVIIIIDIIIIIIIIIIIALSKIDVYQFEIIPVSNYLVFYNVQ